VSNHQVGHDLFRKRSRLFEFEDQGWLPPSIRNAMTDYLRFQWQASGMCRPIAERLSALLALTGSAEILDLASGGGGPVLAIYEHLARVGWEVRVTLSDRFPNLDAFADARARTQGAVQFVTEPVDAKAVPAQLVGVRTMFGPLHHFGPTDVLGILVDAVRQRRAIALFDYPAPPYLPPPNVLGLGTLPGLLLAMPFVRPFRWRHLLWTYLLPVLPVVFTWDALISGLRLYSARELRAIVAELPANDYLWEIGQEPFPHAVTYVIGYPRGRGSGAPPGRGPGRRAGFVETPGPGT
jgi:hypothetical protein